MLDTGRRGCSLAAPVRPTTTDAREVRLAGVLIEHIRRMRELGLPGIAPRRMVRTA